MNTILLTAVWFVAGVFLGWIHGYAYGHFKGWVEARSVLKGENNNAD